MDTEGFRTWYLERVQIADEIVANHSHKGEADAEILLCCSMSALAARMWPGGGIDRIRFIQFLVQFADASLSIERISVPLFANRLQENGNLDAAIRVREKYLPLMPLVLDGDIDKDETALLSALAFLSRKEIRNCSYASAIYIDLRSGLVHEYQFSSHLASYTFADRRDIPSYVNLRDTIFDPITGALSVGGETRRYLHFPYPYVRKVAETAASAAFAYWDSVDSWNRPEPKNWWSEG